MTIEKVMDLAKRIMLIDGEHIPTLIVEGSRKGVAMQIKELPSDGLEKRKEMRLAGHALAKTGELGALEQVFFISEAWLSRIKDGKLPEVPPSQDPERQEVVIISGLEIPSRRTHLGILAMFRNAAGDLERLEEMDMGVKAGDEGHTESPLLEAFVAGYFLGASPRKA